MPQIRTERLVLRPFTQADNTPVLAILNNFEVSKWLHRIPYPFTRDDLRITGPNGESRWPDLAAIEHNGTLVGGITAGDHLGYWVDPACHGQGFASEAARAIVDFTFGNTDRDTLESGYFVGNDKSARILEKLGFRETGVTPQLCAARKENLPSADMLLTRADWLSGHGLPLQSDRIFLRPFSTDDIPALQRIAGNDDVAPMLSSVQSPWPDDAVANWINQSRFRGQLGFRLGMCHKETGDLIGAVGLGGTPMSMMYFIEKPLWGRGLVTEACQILLSFAFDKHQAEEIEADCFADNPVSTRVLEKLGFQQYGTDTANSAARVDAHPVILYRLRRDDYESHRL